MKTPIFLSLRALPLGKARQSTYSALTEYFFLESTCADLWIATLVSLARDDRKWALLLESTFSKEATLCVFCALFKKVDSRFWADFSQELFLCHWQHRLHRVAIHFCGFSLSACLSSPRILGIAVLLVVLFVDFGAELD